MYTRIIHRLGLYLLILTATIPGFSQSLNFKVSYYSVADGLSSREVYDVIQDNRGFIWLSLKNTLNRFDSYTFSDLSNLRITDSGLVSKILSKGDLSVLENSGQNQFLIKYINEPSVFDLIHTDKLSVNSFDLSPLFAGSKLLGFAAIPNAGMIAVIAVKNRDLVMYHFNPADNTIIQKSKYTLDVHFRADSLKNVQISVSSSGLTYLSAAALPLICFDPKEKKAKELAIPISKMGFSLIKANGDNGLYLVDNVQRRLLKYELSDKSRVHIPTPLKGKIDQLWIDLDGNVIMGSAINRYFNELILLPGNGDIPIPLNLILQKENKISQIRGDHFLEQILVPTFSGFYIFSNEKKRFKAILNQPLEEGEWGHVIRSMVEDGQGNLYINEEANSLFKLNLSNDSITKIFKTSAFTLPITGCLKMVDRKLWGISAKTKSQDRLYSFNTVTEKFKFWDLAFANFGVKDFVVLDSTILLFFGRDFIVDTFAVWAFDIQRGQWQPFPLSPVWKDIKVQILLYDEKGTVWIGSVNGLYSVSIKDQTIEKVEFGITPSAVLDFEINALVFHPETNNLLIGSEYGIWVFDPVNRKYIHRYTKEANGLSNNFIEGLLPVRDDKLFATTLFGLSLLDLKSGQAKNYFENDGLAHNEFNRFSIHQGSNSKYYFGGLNGLSAVASADLDQMNSKQVVISRFFRNDFMTGNERSQSANLESIKSFIIEPGDHYFGFDLMYPDFTEPRLNQFQYWLEGYDKDWQPPTTSNRIRYGRLAEGDYMLHLRAFPNLRNESSIAIRVKVHFYQSPWFVPGLIFAFLVLLLASVFYYKINKRNKDLAKQQNDQKFKDLELAALRAQMNPHFIFNCLSSIQQFISVNDAATASRYLSSFSRLVRLALHSSVDGRHNLQDEIDMIDHYLGLERLRFGDKFSYEIDVDQELDKDNIFLPPLLIQPFVENALVHGIKNKTAKGKITISFRQQQNDLKVTVTDNGPGFSVQERIQDGSGHKSVGMTLTKKRLEILSGKDNFSMTPVITEKGHTEGTQVHIVIPIL